MKDLSIALIQTDLYWTDVAANLHMLDQKLDSLSPEADLIVLPEMFSTGFCMEPEQIAEDMDGCAILWMKNKAAARNCVITGSLMIGIGTGSDKKYFNRLIWMRPDGSYEAYDKKHLFSLSLEPKVYTAGHNRLIVELHGWKICPMICYDLRFPVWSRNAINANRQCDYDVLIYVANWPERRVTAWKALLQARAIENQAYVVGVNRIGHEGTDIYYSGDSSVVDPLGNILYRKEHEAEVSIITLNYEEMVKTRRLFPFLKDADGFEMK